MSVMLQHGRRPEEESDSAVLEDGFDPEKTIALDEEENSQENMNRSIMPRKSFIDRQPAASRVSPISDVSQIPQDSNQKRKQKDISDAELDEDDQGPMSRKRRRFGNTENSDITSGERRRRLPSAPSGKQDSRSVDSDRTNGATSIHDDEYQITSSRAVSYDSDSRQYKPLSRPVSKLSQFFSPEPQIRHRYTADEEKRLIELIERYGTRWADIKRADEAHPDGPKLSRRSQVQLKDKARNLYIDYLK